ncbi:MAG TPA: helix-turn-helix transcriptional regulator [Candidatus Limnocylindrales bacterium]|jgi:ribosome-binding protein aMBF1 (putative translation factor)|nr:helix-turn-helix transcriptional regulator [Candidatus Limnocylindrales bacterium]
MEERRDSVAGTPADRASPADSRESKAIRSRRSQREREPTATRLAIASRLVELRKAAGLTQVAVCEQIGKPKGWIAKLETGRRSLLFSEATVLAALYAVDVAAIAPSRDKAHSSIV